MTQPRILLFALFAAAALAACGVDTETDTGMVLVVTLDDTVAPEAVPPDLDTLRFYVATRVETDGTVWVLNEPLAGRPVDIAGRDLRSDPYRLFVGSRANPPETLRVVVVAENGGGPVLGGTLVNPAEQTLQAGKILERTVRLRLGEEMPQVTWTETGCLLSEDGRVRFGSASDQDCDGYRGGPDGPDCNDHDPAIHPGAPDDHDCDGVDNNCDGIIDPGGIQDEDRDGVSPCDGDCNDEDPDVYPGAPEICDGVDNNCNGLCDEGSDADGDGFTTCRTQRVQEGAACVRVLFPDCNDGDPEVYPGAPEVCDGVDNNCNGWCDEGTDRDGDGFNPCGTQNGDVQAVLVPNSDQCPLANLQWIDCNDDNPAQHPYAPEICDGVDNDCDADSQPPNAQCYVVSSETGQCQAGRATCDESEPRWSACVLTNNTPPAPLVRCSAWDSCVDRPDPSLCMDQLITTIPMNCTVHMRHPGSLPCADDPPLYALPFGAALIQPDDCVWTLQLPPATPGWLMVGLVNPYEDPPQLKEKVTVCQAYLVARPYSENDTPSPTLSGYLNLEATYPSGPVLLEIPLTISDSITNQCATYNESMECSY